MEVEWVCRGGLVLARAREKDRSTHGEDQESKWSQSSDRLHQT